MLNKNEGNKTQFKHIAIIFILIPRTQIANFKCLCSDLVLFCSFWWFPFSMSQVVICTVSLPQVSVFSYTVLSLTWPVMGFCPLIDFSFIFSSLLVSLSPLLSLSPLPLPVFILHIRPDRGLITLPLCCTLINQVWRGLFLAPPLINISLIPIGQWVSDPVCFCGINLITCWHMRGLRKQK